VKSAATLKKSEKEQKPFEKTGAYFPYKAIRVKGINKFKLSAKEADVKLKRK